ncbi:MAG TPA: type II secretion system F family protein [Kiritimatiellia bacterium]|nr:type II secretion system F family protein [Kiritimatiellia bacterium]
MNDTLIIFIGILWALGATGVAWYCGRVASQITYVTLADGRRTERRLPLLFRLLLPLAPNVAGWFDRPAFARERERVTERLVAAGYDGLLNAREYLALRVLVPLLAGPALIGLLAYVFAAIPGRPGDLLQERQLLFFLAALLLLALQPASWLRQMLARRHRVIERGLPFVLDLLTLSVEAGLDFMTAIRRVIERRKLDALGEELLRMLRDIQVGKTRRDALRDLGRRSMQSDLNSVVSALVQADELGISLGSILRIQADQMRVRRFQRAEKLAQEAPVKMLFPLVAFIFPAVFIVLLGPVILELLRQGF